MFAHSQEDPLYLSCKFHYNLVTLSMLSRSGVVWRPDGTPVFFIEFASLCALSILVMWSDTLLIVGISVFTALLGEGFTWLLVYRTEKYTRLKQDVEKQAKQICIRRYSCENRLDFDNFFIHIADETSGA